MTERLQDAIHHIPLPHRYPDHRGKNQVFQSIILESITGLVLLLKSVLQVPMHRAQPFPLPLHRQSLKCMCHSSRISPQSTYKRRHPQKLLQIATASTAAHWLPLILVYASS
jgi:hypothetical protein